MCFSGLIEFDALSGCGIYMWHRAGLGVLGVSVLL